MVQENNIVVYKIQHNKTGLFKTAGAYHTFTKNGKTWSRRQDLISSLLLFVETNYVKDESNKYKPVMTNTIPEEWSIVEISTNGVTKSNARAVIDEHLSTKGS